MTGIAERHDKAGHRLLPYEPFSEEGARVPVLLWPRAEDISNEYTIANPSNLSLEFADMVECEEISASPKDKLLDVEISSEEEQELFVL